MKKYLIYLDILGFYKLPKLIANETNIEERKIRTDFLNVIDSKIASLKNNYILDVYKGADDWILVTDELNKVFFSINEILDHNTGYNNQKKIPLEIAIGTEKFDKWAKFNGRNLFVENGTIEFLKSSICTYYRDWFKDSFHKSIESTYILLTKSFFDELDPCDKHNILEMFFNHSEDIEEYEEFAVANIDEFRKRGNILKFQEIIEQSGDKYLQWIDKIYVPPLEYEDIVKTLKESRIVFITGTPEFGKTYTAIKLLWDYFNRGYDPIWIYGEEDIGRTEVRRRFNEASDVKPGRIVYYEDPFGKTTYGKRESLEREIGMVINNIKNVFNAYVIITSREEIFKEFKKENLSGTQLSEFEEKLNIKRPSYDDHKRNLMLLNWAYAENCKWLNNNNLTLKILDLVDDFENLPTPLNIKDFALASSNVDDEDKLKELIMEKSRETSRAFANEIEHMNDDKKLFLMIPYISENLKIDFIKGIYYELVEELHINSAWNFQKVTHWFKNDKIRIKSDNVQFSHSSYREAVTLFLFEVSYSHKSSIMFRKLIIKLCNWDETAKDVLRVVSSHFDKLPEDLRLDLLLKFVDNKRTMWNYSWLIALNFNKIPSTVRNEILMKIYNEYESVWGVLRILKEHFDKIPENLRNEILIHLSEKDEIMEDIFQIFSDNFVIVQEELRNNLLFKFSKNKQIRSGIVQIFDRHFDIILPKEFRDKLLLDLYKNNKHNYDIALLIAKYYNKISPELQIILSDYPNLYKYSINSNFSIIEDFKDEEIDYNWGEKKIVTDFLKDVVSDNFDDINCLCSNCDNNLKEHFFSVIDKNSNEIYLEMKKVRDKINNQMNILVDKIKQDENDFEYYLEEYSAIFLISRENNIISYVGIFHEDSYPENKVDEYTPIFLAVSIPYFY